MGGACCTQPRFEQVNELFCTVSPTITAEYSKKVPKAGLLTSPWAVPEKSLKEIRATLTPYTRQGISNHTCWGLEMPDYQFHEGSVEQIAQALFKGSRASGLWEKCPEKLQGVFWMDGNVVPEVLCTLQYGTWVPEERLLLVPIAPLNWAWPTKVPPKPPLGGTLYYPIGGDKTSEGILFVESVISIKFSSDSLDDAVLQYHLYGNLTRESRFNFGGVAMENTLVEDKSETRPGAKWTRGVRYAFDSCCGVPFQPLCSIPSGGNYTLKKVLDHEGKPIEPYYSELVAFMNGIPLFTCTGKADVAEEKEALLHSQGAEGEAPVKEAPSAADEAPVKKEPSAGEAPGKKAPSAP